MMIEQVKPFVKVHSELNDYVKSVFEIRMTSVMSNNLHVAESDLRGQRNYLSFGL